MQFKSNIFILPGLGNSGEGHWQTIWQNRFGFKRIEQASWDAPVCDDWIARIDEEVMKQPDLADIILIGHSLACTTIAQWAATYNRVIKGALLVAPSDTEAESYPDGTVGFNPMCLKPIQFPSLVVMSNDDFYVTPQRAAFFAYRWGSQLESVGNAGHINVSSGFGEWDEGLQFLQKLDQ